MLVGLRNILPIINGTAILPANMAGNSISVNEPAIKM